MNTTVSDAIDPGEEAYYAQFKVLTVEMVDALDSIEELVMETAIYPGSDTPGDQTGIFYTTMGLAGEAGEVANKVKKIIRDKDGVFDKDSRISIIKELGDVFWYFVAGVVQNGSSLSASVDAVLYKLHSRKERGTLQGSGDER